MKEMAWAIMFSIPWPHQTVDKLVIYTFPSQKHCATAIPGVKRKHRLFFKEVNCVQIGSGPALAEISNKDIAWVTTINYNPR